MSSKSSWIVASDVVVKMYKSISEGIIKYLTDKGMTSPHPSKEFILQMIDKAIIIEQRDRPIPAWTTTYPYCDNNSGPFIWYTSG